MNIAITTVTAPTEYPITPEEVEDHLRITGTAQESLLDTYIAACTTQAQVYCKRQFVTATYDWFFDSLPSDGTALRVPRAPLQSVTTFKYIDEDGTQQTWASSNYRVDTDSAPGRITTAYDVSWPTTREITNALEIRIVTGYGAASAVPEAIKTAIKMMVGSLWIEREAHVLTTFDFKTHPAVRALLDTERLTEFY